MFRRNSAFTLIELLVVIAIIAILAAILFPVFAQARESARKTVCLSNVKQIALGITMYTQDFDETIVPWLQPQDGQPRDSVRSDRLTWVDLLDPYVKNGKPVRRPNIPVNSNIQPMGLWFCPSFSSANMVESSNKYDCGGPSALDPHDLARQYYAHYSIVFPNPPGSQGNCSAFDPHYNYPGSDPLYSGVIGTLPTISRPAETVLLSDGMTVMLNLDNWGFLLSWGCVAAKSHQNGGYHGFVDGHAKFLTGNSERAEATDSFGCVYKKYYSIDR